MSAQHLPLAFWFVPLLLTLVIFLIYRHKVAPLEIMFRRGDVYDKIEASGLCWLYAAISIISALGVWLAALVTAMFLL